MLKLANRIDRLSAAVGIALSYLIYLILAIILFEIFMRSAFNKPTAWVHDLSGWLLVFYVFLGGAFALQRGFFVRVDILYLHFPPRLQAAIEIFIGTVLMALFAWVMIKNGLEFGIRSFRLGEVPSTGSWQGPLWPSKFAIPVGMTLVLLAWLARVIRATIRLIDPTAIEPETDTEAAG